MNKIAGWLLALYAAIVLIGLVGWVKNIMAVFTDCCTPLTGELILRIVGIFVAPLGAVMGFI